MRPLFALLSLCSGLALAACGGGDPARPPTDASPGPAAEAGTVQPPTPDRSLLIVTTRAIQEGSKQLAKFIEEKRRRGMQVDLGTEADYGGPEERGRPRALRIRAWLRSQYRSHSYLLLIGDPGTEYGDVPMLKVRPDDEMQPACPGFDCTTAGTDSFYANPIGEWDLDGNGSYAEWGIDDKPGGVDLYPEMAVGRIPVYFGDTAELDSTIEHLLAYMNADPAQLEYRTRALFAMSMVFFKGEVQFPGNPPITDNVDTAPVAEWLIHKYLTPERGVTSTRLYEREGFVTSLFPGEGALTEDSFVEEWRKGYGMILWGGHGAATSVARTVWTDDRNHNGLADGDEMSSPTLIRTEDATRLEGTRGGFVVAASCLVGRVEVPDSLPYTLMRHGAAVGVVASSAPTSADDEIFRTMGPELDRSAFDVNRVAVVLFDGLVRGEAAGELVGKARYELGPKNDAFSYHLKLMINFYGDPTLTLYDSAADVR